MKKQTYRLINSVVRMIVCESINAESIAQQALDA